MRTNLMLLIEYAFDFRDYYYDDLNVDISYRDNRIRFLFYHNEKVNSVSFEVHRLEDCDDIYRYCHLMHDCVLELYKDE